MAKYLDTFFVLTAVLLGTFALTGLGELSLGARAAISLCALGVAAAVAALLRKRGSDKDGGARNFVTYCILNPEFAKRAFVAAYPNATENGDIFLLDGGAAFIHAKVAKPSADVVLSCYRKFKSVGAKQGFVLCTDCDKSVAAFAASLPDCPVYLPTFRHLWKRVRRCKAAPIAPPIARKFSLKGALLAFFCRKNSYRLAACALVTFLLSFVTVLKTYYIVCGCVLIALAIVARIVGAKAEGGKDIDSN